MLRLFNVIIVVSFILENGLIEGSLHMANLNMRTIIRMIKFKPGINDGFIVNLGILNDIISC